MKLVGAVTLLVMGSIAVVVAAVAIYQGRIWCVPHRWNEFNARWVRRSREGLAFWSNTLSIGGVGIACVVVACRMLFRSG
jgi:hypothetical protein